MKPSPIGSEQALTINDVAALALDLDPRRALRYTNGDQARLCTTDVFTSLIDESGSVVALSHAEGRYGALYVRVSTLGQAEDGYSADDQIRRGIEYFLRRRQAFRIFSDASLSGGLAINEPSLIRKLALAKATRYEKVFTSLFLYEQSRYTETQRIGLRAYLETQREEILRGVNLDPDLVASQPLVEGFTAKYRPALTLLFQSLRQIHTIAVSDLSRVCRSQMLFAELTERLSFHKVGIVGFIESLEYISQDDLGITAFVLSKMAEMKLREVLSGTLRGLAALLHTGRPHGLLPFWLFRDERGFAQIKPDLLPMVRRLVDLYLHEGLGQATIAKQMQREGYPPPRSGTWSVRYVAYTLASPALIGKQIVFGVEWSVLPPVISPQEWDAIQAKLHQRREDYPQIRHGEVRLLSGILRCSCGAAIAGNKRSSAKYAVYTCLAGPVKRMVNPGHVFQVNMRDADRFFEDLLREHPAVVLAAYKDSRQRNALLDDVRRLEAAAHAARQRRDAQATGTAAETARQRLTAAHLTATPDLVRSVVAQLLAPLDAEAADYERQAQDVRGRLDALIPEEAVVSLEDRIGRWEKLTTNEKNLVLRTIFEEVRVEGEPGHERLVPYLRTLDGRGRRPILLQTKIDKAGRYWRRFPLRRVLHRDVLHQRDVNDQRQGIQEFDAGGVCGAGGRAPEGGG